MEVILGFDLTRGLYASRLILRPNLPYRAAFSSRISSRSPLNFSSSDSTLPLILSTEDDSRSWTSETGNEKNESPIRYLCRSCQMHRLHGKFGVTYGTLSSSSASSSSAEISSRSSFSF